MEKNSQMRIKAGERGNRDGKILKKKWKKKREKGWNKIR